MTYGIKEIVFANLDAAAENGYFEPGEYLQDATAEEIADDMVAFAADCEDYAPADLLPFVGEWKAARAA